MVFKFSPVLPVVDADATFSYSSSLSAWLAVITKHISIHLAFLHGSPYQQKINLMTVL
jgi:hypothetical protein